MQRFTFKRKQYYIDDSDKNSIESSFAQLTRDRFDVRVRGGSTADLVGNIAEYLWIYTETRGEETYRYTLGLIKNGKYFVYASSSTAADIWFSNTSEEMIHLMPENIYAKFVFTTEPEDERYTEEKEIESHCYFSDPPPPLEEDQERCRRCKWEPSAGCFGEAICADCYWDEDYEYKRRRRMDPAWRAIRARDMQIILNEVNQNQTH